MFFGVDKESGAWTKLTLLDTAVTSMSGQRGKVGAPDGEPDVFASERSARAFWEKEKARLHAAGKSEP